MNQLPPLRVHPRRPREAYGLIGVYATLQATLQVLDLGLSPTVNRELSRLSAVGDLKRDGRDFFRTIEGCYWIIGILLATGMVLGSSFLAESWIRPSSLTTSQVGRALRAMAVVIALQWPVSLYQGGLLGLQRQGAVGLVSLLFSTVRYAGAAAALMVFGASIDVFFKLAVCSPTPGSVFCLRDDACWNLHRHLDSGRQNSP